MTDITDTSLPPGRWLLFDAEDTDIETDFAVWQHAPQLDANEVLIDWSGCLLTTSGATMSVDRMAFRSRYARMQLDDHQFNQLAMAAAHGCFRRVAQRIWKERQVT